MTDGIDPTTSGDIDTMSDAISQTEKERLIAILDKQWLDEGDRNCDPQPLTEEEVHLLAERLPTEFAVEEFEDRGDGKFWHVPTWFDFRSGGWMRDEYGKVY